MDLGKIIVSTEEKTALLEVSTEQAKRCSLIVQNKVGRPCYEKQFNLEAGTHSLKFPIGALKAGNYFVWLHFDNQTKMTAFEIVEEETPPVAEKKSVKFSFNFFSW
jgi:hypothetical protein